MDLSGNVDGDGGRRRALFVRDRAGDTAAHLGIGFFLPVGIEDVPVVDPALKVQDPDLAQSAFPLAAVEHHVQAGTLERFEHRFV